MNEQLHTLLDGEDPGGNSGPLFASEAERREFAEHRRLQQAMRRQTDVGALSASEKATMGAALAATIGLETPNPVPTSTPTTPTALVPVAGRRRLIGAAIFAAGIGLGAGLFALLDDDTADVTRTQGFIIPSETTTPALFPFALPEPTTAEECAAEIARLQDSMKNMQDATSTTATPGQTKRPVTKKRRPKLPHVTPGTW